MATISKFYLLNATSPNLGSIIPSATDFIISPHLGAGSDAAGAFTSRDATGTPGTSNPDIDATGTAAAVTTGQRYCLRRFVSRPLAGQTVSAGAGGGNVTFSYARGESNTNHNGDIHCRLYFWRPTTGLRVGTAAVNCDGTNMSATAETFDSVTAIAAWSANTTLNEGDILVWEVGDEFLQGMATAYTSFFSYDGTTEGSATTCASFTSHTVAFTLSDNPWPKNAAINYQDPGVMMKAFGYAKRNWMWKPLKRPSLWTPELWRPEFWLPDHVAQGEIAV